ncbi:MAG: hypothetical protein IGS38_09255 [Synechococcales cyanobacterium M58_A2018_015]|nr:hypothetical protein [Synechococcales cyanobacterium M58_A2018_015]
MMPSLVTPCQGWSRVGLAFAASLSLSMGLANPASAIDETTLLLLTDPLQLELLRTNGLPTDGSVITPNTISQDDLTVPSLWWTQEQFGGELLNFWLAFPGTDGTPPRVELLVNPQVWNNYNYMQRYAFLNQFGTAGKDFGYSTRVFNLRGELLGAYICDFDAVAATQAALQSQASLPRDRPCRVFLDPLGPGALRGATPFGASAPTDGGIPR